MKTDFYKNYSGDEWSLSETSYHPANESAGGSFFCIGNGYMGLRGSYEELGTKKTQGLYVPHLYRKDVDRLFEEADTFCRKKYIFDEEAMTEPWCVEQIQNLPDPLLLRVYIDEVPFCLWDGKLLSYERRLNLKTGVLSRVVRWDNGSGKISLIRIERFCSMSDRQLIAQRYSLIPENWSGSVRLESGIDAGLNNGYEECIDWLSEGAMTLNGLIPSTGMQFCQQVDHRLLIDGKSAGNFWGQKDRSRRYVKTSVVELCQGQELTLEKFCAVGTVVEQGHVPELMVNAERTVSVSRERGFECCCRESADSWRLLWGQADIRLDGDPDAQRFLRYGLFHLIIASPRDDARSSIAAKALTGPGYGGHVFWDTDINLFPFYQWVFPDWAKGHCRYRYRLLDAARRAAESEGLRGARYPWISAFSGDEQTPPAITCGHSQIHVVPDVAYAMFKYFESTGDERWWQEQGLEAVTECARYMADKVSFNEEEDRFEILGVGGPDEYHPVTDNNAYTNYMTAELLGRCASEWRSRIDELEKLSARLNVSADEPDRWSKIAKKMYKPVSDETGVIPQCDGFFDLKDEWEASGASWGGPSAEYHECKGIKQPDVLLLVILLAAQFEHRHLLANWDYYERFVLHGSSLSPSIHALAAARLGLVQKARYYFNLSAKFDFLDPNNDTARGIHIGNFGGLWQAMIYGFAGMELRSDELCFSPALPLEWTSITFRVVWKGNGVCVQAKNKTVCIAADSANRMGVSDE
jgi:kojibiose phosphorylase